MRRDHLGAEDASRPKTIVDLATLTGAMIIALGNEHGGLFANDDGLADKLLAAGKAVGRPAVALPAVATPTTS